MSLSKHKFSLLSFPFCCVAFNVGLCVCVVDVIVRCVVVFSPLTVLMALFLRTLEKSKPWGASGGHELQSEAKEAIRQMQIIANGLFAQRESATIIAPLCLSTTIIVDSYL